VVDVHSPHGSIHSWRDFLVHLLTITIGLLIALGMEGAVEWMHQRHLVHEAKDSLHAEIAQNAGDLAKALADLHERQKELKNDMSVLWYATKNGKLPEHGTISITFHLTGLRDVSWKTAQSTGALAYMSYADAQRYSEIYATQEELYASEQVAARDAIISLAPLVDAEGPDEVKVAETAAELEKVEVLAGQLLLVDALMGALRDHYQNYLGSSAALQAPGT
jgi:hypothetical protein